MTLGRFTFRSFLRRWFRRVPVPPSFAPLAAAPDKFSIVTQSSSVVIAALLDAFAAQAKISAPARYAPKASTEKAPAAGLQWISIHDTAALSGMLAANPPRQFVTLSIFERRGPINSNPSNEISIFRLIEIMLTPRKLVIAFGVPQEFPAEGSAGDRAKFVHRLQRKLKLDFFRTLKLVRGTPFQPIAVQARLVLSGADFEREVGILSTKLHLPRERIVRMAEKEFYTIAANPIRPLYSIAARVCRFITKKLFGQVTTVGLERFMAAAKNNTVVLVPMHRSHFDYVLVGSQLYDSNVNPPLVAAGVNLSFWPVGFLIRSLGAYFVKRNARLDKLHALVLRRYVTYLVKRGHLQEFFIEGGRSRSGRMRAPKVGLLSTIVEAFQKGLRKDIVFIPVSITYENVIEDKTFGDENTGVTKRRENFWELLKARSIFRNRYGDAVLSFGTPISLVAETERIGGSKVLRAGGGTRNVVREMARLLTVRIRSQTSISLTALAYTALMTTPRYGLQREELIEAIRNLARIVSLARKIDPEIGEYTPTLSSFLGGADHLLEDLLRGGNVVRGFVLRHEIFFVPGKRRFTADFYKNSLFHLFVPIGMLAVLQCLGECFTVEDALPIRAIFCEDLLLPDADEFTRQMTRWCELLVSEGILEAQGASYRFLRRPPGIFIPHLLLAPIESVLWSFRSIRAAAAAEDFAAGEPQRLPYQKTLRRAQEEFRTAHYLGLTSRTEASSQSSLQAALEILAQRELVSYHDHGSAPSELVLLKDSSPDLDLLQRLQNAIAESASPSAR